VPRCRAWAAFVERGKRNVGYTVWEIDTPAGALAAAARRRRQNSVPSAANKALFERAGIAASVAAVPHASTRIWRGLADTALRHELGVPTSFRVLFDHVWDPRKAVGDLGGIRPFCGDDTVTLVVKTSSHPHEHGCDRDSPTRSPSACAS
jgi:hypothetical protein